MGAFDIAATLPSYPIAFFVGIWLYRHGDEPVMRPWNMWGLVLGVALLISAWTSAFDYFSNSDGDTWFIHFVIDLAVPAVSIFVSFLVSLRRPVKLST